MMPQEMAIFRIVQRFADVTIFQHQRRRAPVGYNAVVNIPGEGACCNGRGPGVKEEAKAKGEVGGRIALTGIQLARGSKRPHPLRGGGMKHACRSGAHADADQAADDKRFY